MLVFGSNLAVLGKAVKLDVVQIAAYRFKDGEAVFLYDTRAIGNLLNIPATIYKNYNAWLQIPGEWSRYYSELVIVKIGRNKLTSPAPLGKDIVEISKPYYNDLFDFIRKVYHCKDVEDAVAGRIFDLIYTMSRFNMLDFKRLLDDYADKW